MSAFQNVLNGLDWTILRDILISVIPATVCITLHEVAHGYVALCLGDTTAKDAGRLTLNPLKHIDIMGLIMMIIFHFGWAKPVPVNMSRFHNPKTGMAICAAAGPLCNILLSALLMILYGLVYFPLANNGGEWAYIILNTILSTSYMSITLAIFNVLPISPLDGSKILFSFMKPKYYLFLMRYERYGMLALAVIMWSGVLGSPLSNASSFLFEKFFVLAQLAGDIVQKFI